MALLSVPEEMSRARINWPFTNGYELESWSDIWCGECTHFQTCPLLTVVVFGRTPSAWEDRDPGALNRYYCHEYEKAEEKP